MAKVIYNIHIEKKLRSVKKKEQNKLLWHDSKNNRMLTFIGGKIVPVYNQQLKTLIPKVEDVYSVVNELSSNEQDILDWIENFGSRMGGDIVDRSDRYISIEVNDLSRDLFEFALDRQGFRYDLE